VTAAGAEGSSGGNSFTASGGFGGLGESVSADFAVQPGQILTASPACELFGDLGTGSEGAGNGGNGGEAAELLDSSGTALLIAGGGGGGGGNW
jgi:hypothetical protein